MLNCIANKILDIIEPVLDSYVLKKLDVFQETMSFAKMILTLKPFSGLSLVAIDLTIGPL